MLKVNLLCSFATVMSRKFILLSVSFSTVNFIVGISLLKESKTLSISDTLIVYDKTNTDILNFLQTGYTDCLFSYVASPGTNSMKTNESRVELV